MLAAVFSAVATFGALGAADAKAASLDTGWTSVRADTGWTSAPAFAGDGGLTGAAQDGGA
ncbi:hypothetical protein ACFF45_18290 [Streptomyces cinereospinus]|uniref:5'-nucleotidase n=1 Tax=Streptomyces cinereospinus TaxID=285561 RepID=A0ABV5N454_9ACTN